MYCTMMHSLLCSANFQSRVEYLLVKLHPNFSVEGLLDSILLLVITLLKVNNSDFQTPGRQYKFQYY